MRAGEHVAECVPLVHSQGRLQVVGSGIRIMIIILHSSAWQARGRLSAIFD